jgi:hypothetical protein
MKLNFHNYKQNPWVDPNAGGSESNNLRSFGMTIDEPVQNIKAIPLIGGRKQLEFTSLRY